MTLRTQSGFLLPPRPRASDWTYAGLSAGMILGISEVLVAYPAGSPPPPPIALLIIGANALLVGVISSLLGFALRTSKRRISHSGMVGAMLGPLLGASIAGLIWQHATLPGMPTALFLSGLATALMLAVAASLAAMRLGETLERGARSLSGPFIWFAVALPMAAAERILWLQTGKVIEVVGLIGIPFLVVAIAMATFEWVRRRGSRPPRSFRRVTALLVLGAIAVAFLPWALPWVLGDFELPELDEQAPYPSRYRDHRREDDLADPRQLGRTHSP